MKKYYYVFIALLIFQSCQPKDEGLPDEIEELKTLQRDTKKGIKDMEKKLVEIEEKMADIDPTLFEKPEKLVTVIDLAKGDFERFIELQGAVEADETVYVSSETGGRITNMTIKDGDYVSKGKLIASIDLESLDKQVAEVQKSLELARQVFERQDRLWKQNIGTEIQYLQAKNNVERLETSIETLKFEQTKSNIYSPISGEVAMVNKERGEVASPGEPLATLLNTRKLKVAVDIPENLLSAVNRGDKVNVRIPAIDYEKEHTIKRIGTQINPANRTIPVEVEIYNPKGEIKPNLLATMFIKDFESEDVLTIPTTLLQQEVSGKYFVYVTAENDGRKVAEKRYVTSGESYGTRIIISTGLTADDQLINKGSRLVSPGELLNIESVMSIDSLDSKMN